MRGLGGDVFQLSHRRRRLKLSLGLLTRLMLLHVQDGISRKEGRRKLISVAWTSWPLKTEVKAIFIHGSKFSITWKTLVESGLF